MFLINEIFRYLFKKFFKDIQQQFYALDILVQVKHTQWKENLNLIILKFKIIIKG